METTNPTDKQLRAMLRSVGLSRSNAYDIVSGRLRIGLETACKVADKYPEIQPKFWVARMKQPEAA